MIAPGGDLAQRLENIDHDWFFSIANLRLLPAAVWRKARAGAANFHDGPLPLYAGLNTPAWAILSGESAYGVTWHALADGVDTGAIHVQHRFDISSDDTALTLNTKCFEAGIASFTELLDMIEGDALVARPQEVSERKYFAKHAGRRRVQRSISPVRTRYLRFAAVRSARFTNPRAGRQFGTLMARPIPPLSVRGDRRVGASFRGRKRCVIAPATALSELWSLSDAAARWSRKARSCVGETLRSQRGEPRALVRL